MKFSIIRNTVLHPNPSWGIRELVRAGEKMGIPVDIINNEGKDAATLAALCGDVVLWRSASNHIMEDRRAIANALRASGKHILNEESLRNPELANKLYQYKLILNNKKILAIPTFTFNTKEDLIQAINTEKISFPIIQKPKVGACGEHIVLLRKIEDITVSSEELPSVLFQPFLKNTGDFRIFILGGVVIGIIKRIAKKGAYLNNIAQGGSSEAVHDPILREKLVTIAEQVTSLCKLHIFGLDVLLSEEDDLLYFLEINTVPQWPGLQNTTGVPVAEEIITLAKHIDARNKKPTVTLISDYYTHYQKYISFEKQFHFHGRLWLWSGNKESANWLRENQEAYIGSNSEETIASALLLGNESSEVAHKYNGIRIPILAKYPNITGYLRALFISLHARNIYGLHIAIPEEHRSKMEEYYKSLSTNPQDVAILSTIGVNFLYLFNKTWPDNKENKSILPEYILHTATHQYNALSLHKTQLQLYLLTHSIIGETHFYRKPIIHHKELYQNILTTAEQTIHKHYDNLPLDIKFEFLVCAVLCKYDTFLTDKIVQEGNLSISPIGNFLVDTPPKQPTQPQMGLQKAEHRNVLFIMSQTPYNPPEHVIHSS